MIKNVLISFTGSMLLALMPLTSFAQTLSVENEVKSHVKEIWTLREDLRTFALETGNGKITSEIGTVPVMVSSEASNNSSSTSSATTGYTANGIAGSSGIRLFNWVGPFASRSNSQTATSTQSSSSTQTSSNTTKVGYISTNVKIDNFQDVFIGSNPANILVEVDGTRTTYKASVEHSTRFERFVKIVTRLQKLSKRLEYLANFFPNSIADSDLAALANELIIWINSSTISYQENFFVNSKETFSYSDSRIAGELSRPGKDKLYYFTRSFESSSVRFFPVEQITEPKVYVPYVNPYGGD